MIEINNVTKEYTRKQGFLKPKKTVTQALKDISFTVDAGEIIGYIGGNGAGKSTTLKLMLGIIRPTHGEIKINNEPLEKIKRNAYLKQVGIVYGQRTQLWWDLPLIESFKLIKELYEVPTEKFEHNLEILADMLELKELLNNPVRTLSLGQRVKADLLAVLLYEPNILFLDEALNGVDTKSIERIITFLKQINQERNITIVFTSHNLAVVEKLCQRIIILDKGHKVYDGGIKKFKSNCKYDMMAEIEVADPKQIADIFANSMSNVDYKLGDNKIEIMYNSNDYKLINILKNLADIDIIDVQNSEISLEYLI